MKKVRFLTAVLAAFIAASFCAHVEAGVVESGYTEKLEQNTPPGIQDKEVPGQGKHKGWEQGQHHGWGKQGQGHGNKQKLMELKEQDPQQFQRVMNRRRQHIQNRLSDLKKENPERYENLTQNAYNKRHQWMEHLKEEDPDRYQEILDNRKGQLDQRLEQL